MSFVWKAAQRLRTPEQVMAVIIATVDELNMPDKRGAAICAGMCVAQESDFWCPWNAADPESKNYPYDSQSDDGRSVGYYQQQKGPDGALWWGPTSQEMDLKLSTREFLTRLKKVGYNASNAQEANDSVQAVQRSGVPQGYVKHWDRINNLYNSVHGGAVQEPTVPDNRPDFNEYAVWSNNSQSRNGTKIDAIFIHTQESDGTADSLAHWLQGNVSASYHYTASKGANDDGVTVCDVVDTDLASWSVLSANNRSINYCFAGSRAAWTRQQWLDKVGRAIDVVAYLIVQDCKKYGIPTKVIAPPYKDRIPGISDHAYVTKVLGDGSHTDVGPNFPWDVLTDSINKYANGTSAPPVINPPPAGPTPIPRADADLQLTTRFHCLGGQTIVEAVAQLRDKVLGTNDRNKPGAL